ncbi:cysteine synthase A [Mesoterricola silvestris]|uniref:Cysteine synthase n=1 Tax=Mesoterricola silvestris TaxID=2927979 RepID=A0AA48KBV5_9BACT|nr:cysteine synthase A [Mesoterricola silvestris]BDU74707.1 cysteine synthase [Mesoterricola silvestris]
MPRPNRVDYAYQLIGNTPVVRLNRIAEPGSATIYLKLESANPGGSVKDRIALSMIEDAERSGALKPGKELLEATSGNTGVGLAFVAAAKGYPITLIMPETMTLERRAILKAYGATLILTPGPLGMKGAVDKAEELAAADPKYWVVRQFDNPANPDVHRRTTAEEVLEQVPELDAFVAGIGTGGTITGVGEVLAKRKPGTLVVAVEPVDSPLLTQGKAGPHKLQGLGANFVPKILNREAFQRVEDVGYEDAIRIARRLTREEGIFTGISTGAIVFTALKIAKELGAGKTVVAVVCDTGERYLTHPLFSEA